MLRISVRRLRLSQNVSQNAENPFWNPLTGRRELSRRLTSKSRIVERNAQGTAGEFSMKKRRDKFSIQNMDPLAYIV